MLDQNDSSDMDKINPSSQGDHNNSGTQDELTKQSLLGDDRKPSESGRSSRKQSKIATASYVQRTKFGMGGDDSEEDDPDIIAATIDKTPMTKRRIMQEANVKKQKKLGPIATGFTIFKGFVCTGILYMPGDFVKGGYGFSGLAVIGALFLTLYCAMLLLEVYAEVGGSLPEIGYHCYGKPGKIAVDISLFGSQFGFVCAYIYFIASQIGGEGGIVQCVTSSEAYDDCSDGTTVNKWWFLIVGMCIYVPLVMVRKIEVFATTHLFGDVMILITIVVVCAYAGIEVRDNGWDAKGAEFINSTLWPDAIGFAVYAFEGIGVVLPIMEITERKDIYMKVLSITCVIIAVLYVGFSEYCFFAFGPTTLTKPLITDSLPPKSILTYIVKIAFSLNLIFSYPLVIHPANLVIESYLFKGWPKTRKRQMCKNLTRTCIVAATCVTALLVYENLTAFLSITGAATCTPIAFTLPALFHYKQCAKTTGQKVIDMSIVIGSSAIAVYCTIIAIITFGD